MKKEVSSLKRPNFLSKIFHKDSSPVLKTNGFYFTDACINCGMCEKNCPEKAIQYGKETENRNRYIKYDNVICVDIYFDQNQNIFVVPSVYGENDFCSISYHYSILEKGYTESDFKEAIAKAIDISEKNIVVLCLVMYFQTLFFRKYIKK